MRHYYNYSFGRNCTIKMNRKECPEPLMGFSSSRSVRLFEMKWSRQASFGLLCVSVFELTYIFGRICVNMVCDEIGFL